MFFGAINKKGFSLVELLLSVSVFALFSLAFFGAFAYGSNSQQRAYVKMRALLVADEGLEAVRSIKNNDFSSLVSGKYGLTVMNNKWQLTNNIETIEMFTREITVADVDLHAKEIISTVYWNNNLGANSSVALTARLTDWNTLASSTTGCQISTSSVTTTSATP